jgi:hypothetical protein
MTAPVTRHSRCKPGREGEGKLNAAVGRKLRAAKRKKRLDRARELSRNSRLGKIAVAGGVRSGSSGGKPAERIREIVISTADSHRGGLMMTLISMRMSEMIP